nr:GNAT family N-acetyltransferase [Treponema denticola]
MSDTRIINISKITVNDCYEISKCFEEQQWQKPIEQYIQYMDDQNNGLIDVLLAKDNNKFAGYCIIQWKSEYTFFYKNDIPEIKDLNVLKKYQRKGIATALMEEAEKRIFYKSNLCGL